MPKAFIKLGYRQIFDATCEDNFSKAMLNLSFDEFRLKCQAYNTGNKFTTFSELKANDGRANSLHYKAGFAVAGLIEKLDKKIPGLYDCMGTAVMFDTCKFEVIESDITDISKHKIAIHYFTGVCTLHEIIGDNLLLSYGEAIPGENSFAETFLLKIQGSLSVIHYREAPFFNMAEMPGNRMVEA